MTDLIHTTGPSIISIAIDEWKWGIDWRYLAREKCSKLMVNPDDEIIPPEFGIVTERWQYEVWKLQDLYAGIKTLREELSL